MTTAETPRPNCTRSNATSHCHWRRWVAHVGHRGGSRSGCMVSACRRTSRFTGVDPLGNRCDLDAPNGQNGCVGSAYEAAACDADTETRRRALLESYSSQRQDKAIITHFCSLPANMFNAIPRRVASKHVCACGGGGGGGEERERMDFSSFVTSLGTSLIIFVVLMLAFTWLKRKPGNAVIYYPNHILRGVDPLEGRTMTRNPLAWIKEAVKASEADVIAAAGVDAAVYLVFLSSGMASTPVVFKCSRLKVFSFPRLEITHLPLLLILLIDAFVDAVLAILVFSGIILLPVLLPVAATANGTQSTTDSNSQGSFKNLDKLTMGHVQVSYIGRMGLYILFDDTR
ncbi:hypothetical protein B296_00037745 [Ensete ventricosum]|uniref:CSC1/OSCA1-like N-terminal transmembrane domain-containing protein n=1 Tax=Ensete ventricosum TaxID=4639 RepID=A0A426ZUD8_ENSVE|nr:hypothetical protein B296_00037745 [Ensete ventricosum]